MTNEDNVTDIQSYTKSQSKSQDIDSMISLLDKYKEMLEQAKESQHLTITANDTEIPFEIESCAVVLGNGQLVIQEGLKDFNAIELLGLSQSINGMALEET